MNQSLNNLSQQEWQKGYQCSAPRGTAPSGRLEFMRGVSLVTIAGTEGMDDLFRARFEGLVPNVQVRDGVVSVRYRRLSLAEWAKHALLWGRHAAEITLHAGLSWQIVVRGGASKLLADLRGLHFSAFTVQGGASDVTMLLPQPAGVVPIRIAGGVNNVTLRRPAGAAAGLRVRGGASKLTFDNQHFGAISGGTRLATTNYGDVADRYEIEIAGGASWLTVDL